MDRKNQNTLLWKFLSWYSPIHWWKEQIHRELYRFNVWKLDEEEANKFVSIFTIHRPYFKHPNGSIYTQNQALSYATFPNLKTFMKPNNPPFWKEELTIHLHEINDFKITQQPVSSSCNKLKNLDLICSPDWEVSSEVWNEEFKRVHIPSEPPNNIFVSESNLLWQDWQQEEKNFSGKKKRNRRTRQSGKIPKTPGHLGLPAYEMIQMNQIQKDKILSENYPARLKGQTTNIVDISSKAQRTNKKHCGYKTKCPCQIVFFTLCQLYVVVA